MVHQEQKSWFKHLEEVGGHMTEVPNIITNKAPMRLWTRSRSEVAFVKLYEETRKKNQKNSEKYVQEEGE